MEFVRIRKDPFKSLENFSLIHVEFYAGMPKIKRESWVRN